MTLFTKPMKLLTAVVITSRSEAVAHKLLELGLLDFIDVKSLDIKLPPETRKASPAALDSIFSAAKALYGQAGLILPQPRKEDVLCMMDFDQQKASTFIESLGQRISDSKASLKSLNESLIALEEFKDYIDTGRLNYLQVHIGSFPKPVDIKSKLGDCMLVDIPGEPFEIIAALRRDGAKVNPLLEKLGWTETDDVKAQKASTGLVYDKISKQTDDIREQMKKLAEAPRQIILESKAELDGYYKAILVARLCSKIKDSFTYTQNTSFFSGWVPSESAEILEQGIKEASEGSCIIEWTQAEKVKDVPIPVQISSPKILSPFARLVTNYSIPEYKSLNPVPVVVVTYLCMFALMFADLGQGFILLLLGLYKTWDYGRNPLKKDGMINRNISALLIYLGVASMIGGLLFGSCFGYSWIPALWFNYHRVVNGASDGLVKNVYSILGITIRFGVAVIFIGLIMNWINLYRKKRWVDLFLDKYGIAGGWLFAVGYWAASAFVKSGYKSMPEGMFLPIAIVIGAGSLLFREPLVCILEHKRIRFDIMEWMVQLLEVFSGYLANTLSFMRVAGLGIAHVSLMTAFEQMADMTEDLAFKILIMALGNVLVIAIEGLSAGIQALRLNYYEFFTKFFTGGGVVYRPMSIENN